MKTTAITPEDLAASVIAVPPLCRDQNLHLHENENRKLIHYLEAGGIRTLLYGGNANLYNVAVSEYAALLDFLAETVGRHTWIIPSAGPLYGTLLDQADILKNRKFPTVMILPTLFPATPRGVARAIRHFAERSSLRVVLYIKDPTYLTPKMAAELVDDGLVTMIKYAIVREDPLQDDFLRELIDLVGTEIIVSGIGEQPAINHLLDFRLQGFTSGCVCVAPKRSMAMLRALQQNDRDEAESIRTRFAGLEAQRNTHGPIPVLHHAVALAGIAHTGPMYPLLSDLPEENHPAIQREAAELLTYETETSAH